MAVFLILLGLITGVLIGMIGIGGILLAPMLTFALGVPLHVAMASSSFSFLFTAVTGTLLYAKKGTINWQMVSWLSLGIIPATLLGARTNVILSAKMLTLILAVLLALSGFNALRKPAINQADAQKVNSLWLLLIGAIVGFGSALTGTGGPVLLVPILITLSISALTAVGVSQAIQLPIAIFATAGFFLFGEINIQLGMTLGIVQVFGVLLGARIAHTLPTAQLRRIMAWALIGSGAFLILRAVG